MDNFHETSTDLSAYCRDCMSEHNLGVGKSIQHAQKLMQWLETERRIDYLSPQGENPQFSIDSLFGESRGKMFGILEGVDSSGKEVVLYGFSGQFNGLWNVPGWVGPLFDEERWQTTNYQSELEIKRIGHEIDRIILQQKQSDTLKNKRKQMSQQLMRKIHKLYSISNFHGQTRGLHPFFKVNGGIPTGTGDCCAPKLLNHAQKYKIVPRGITEFYWGKENKSATRKHGQFYAACSDKCGPILGYMLCGLRERQQQLTTLV